MQCLVTTLHPIFFGTMTVTCEERRLSTSLAAVIGHILILCTFISCLSNKESGIYLRAPRNLFRFNHHLTGITS